MTTTELTDTLHDLFYNMLEDTTNPYSDRLFKRIVPNNVIPFTAVDNVPAILFYISESKYTEDRLRVTSDNEVSIYIYNRYNNDGHNLPDILSNLIDRVRDEVRLLEKNNNNVLKSYVTLSTRDGGTVLPYTVGHLLLKVTTTGTLCTN